MKRKLFLTGLLICAMGVNVAIASDECKSENVCWENSKKNKYYETYISSFSDGENIEKAKKKQEKIDYKASKKFDIHAYYLKKYPEGKYVKKLSKSCKKCDFLPAGSYSRLAFASNGFKLYYKNTTPNILGENLSEFFRDWGYHLESGSELVGSYGKGSSYERIMGGAFSERALFDFSIKKLPNGLVELNVKKGMNGFSGGVIGFVMMNNTYDNIFTSLSQANL